MIQLIIIRVECYYEGYPIVVIFLMFMALLVVSHRLFGLPYVPPRWIGWPHGGVALLKCFVLKYPNIGRALQVKIV